MKDEDAFIAFIGAVTVAAVAVAFLSLLSGCTTHVCQLAVLTDSPVAVETRDDIDVDAEDVEVQSTIKEER